MILRIGLLIAVSLSSVCGQHNVNKTDVDKWMKELSNWARWGKDDQIGAVHLITPAKRKAAAALVTEGYSVSLARDTEMTKEVDNQNPWP